MRIIPLILGMMFSVIASAQALYQEGVHYNVLPQPVKTITPGKIEVTEAFAYTCGHCYNFEPLINRWIATAADDVELVKLPVVWKPSMQVFARILYTGKALGKYDEVNAAVFNAIHRRKIAINSEKAIADLFAELGVDKERFTKTFNSFGVSSRVRQAEARTQSMKVTGTPQMIVDGRFTVSASRNLGHEAMLKVVDFLIDKVRAERQG